MVPLKTVHFSSTSPHWRTPNAIYTELDREFGFTFDPCPAEPKFDGLMVEWGKRNFVNPPYGRALPQWIEKAYREHLLGRLSVLLIPARTDTAWWHDYIMRADEIRFIRGRLQFHARIPQRGKGFGKGGLGAAPFPSAVVVFGGWPPGLRL
jgi:phage N-6-adenine-methyltransferase